MRGYLLVLLAFGLSFPVGRWSFNVNPPASDAGRVVSGSVSPAKTQIAGGASKSVVKKPASTPAGLLDALKHEDAFASARAVVAWLENSTTESFRDFEERPKSFPWLVRNSAGKAFEEAFFASVADRWYELNPEGALKVMRQEAAPGEPSAGRELLKGLARARPKVVLETVPLQSKGGELEPHAAIALQMLARTDLRAVRRYLDACDNPASKKAAAVAIGTGLAESDPLGAIAFAKEHNLPEVIQLSVRGAERIGSGMLGRVLNAAGAALDPKLIKPALFLRHPELSSAVEGIDAPGEPILYVTMEGLIAAERLTQDERRKLLESSDALPERVRDSTIAAVASVWARSEPTAALEWTLGKAVKDDPASPRNFPVTKVFAEWINVAPDAALHWWRGLGDSPLKDSIGVSASRYLVDEGRLEDAIEAFVPRLENATGAGQTAKGFTPAEQSAASLLVLALGENNLASAGEFYASLPDKLVNDTVAKAVALPWFRKDPASLAQWIGQLPPGDSRDAAAMQLIEEASWNNVTFDPAWFDSISDPQRRQSAIRQAYYLKRCDDPGAAVGWLESCAGVDPIWKARVLRRAQ